MEGRFGIPEYIFDSYLMFRRKRIWWLVNKASQIELAAQLKICQVGLKAFQRVGQFVKPSTRMIQCFGHHATRARITVTEAELSDLLAGNRIPTDMDLAPGYVILSLRKNVVLGLGLFLKGQIRSQISRKELRETMLQS